MESLIELLQTAKPGILILHLIGTALGVGGATANDFLFFRFLKDLKISRFEASILRSLSIIIWVGLITLIISGIGLYLQDMEHLNQSSKFLTKVVVVAVIFINGLALNLFASPRLKHISFQEKHRHVSGELRNIRRISFALGAISIISWYTALILGALSSLPYSAITLITIYFVILFIGITISQLTENWLTNRKKKK